jgi:hypothetical protein
MSQYEDPKADAIEHARRPDEWAALARALRRAARVVLAEAGLDEMYSSLASRGPLSTEQELREVVEDLPSDWDDRRRVRGVYMMLAGFAVENLIKGLLIVKYPERVTADSGIGFPFRTAGHDTLPLFNQSGFKLTQPERELVAALQRYVNWAGRYPVALTVDESTNLVWTSQYPSRVDDLLNRLEAELDQASQQAAQQVQDQQQPTG